MKKHRSSPHSAEALLPVILFSVFTLCAVTLIMLAANIYRKTTENSFLNNTARTSLAYITEKVHRYDKAGCVDITVFEGCDALVLSRNTETGLYHTYIYVYDGRLRELFIKEGTRAYPDSGTGIMDAEDFHAEFTGDNILQIYFTAPGKRAEQAAIGLKHHRK